MTRPTRPTRRQPALAAVVTLLALGNVGPYIRRRQVALRPALILGLPALAGSWIGGSANMIAVAESVGTPDSILGPIIVVDTAVGYGWMGVLLFLSAFQHRFDRWSGADTTAIQETNAHMRELESHRHPIEVKDLAITIGLAFAGAVADEALERAYAEADLFVLPSHHEGYGMAIGEALRRGLPIVTSRAGAIPEVVGDGAMLLPPGDVNALSTALARLMSRADERRRLGEAAARAGAALPDWRQSEDAFLVAVDRLAWP